MAEQPIYDLCVLVTQPPQAGFLGEETFDLAVAGGVFDLSIVVLFWHEAAMHLVLQNPATGLRNTGKLWQSASLFGIERIALVEPIPHIDCATVPADLQPLVEVVNQETASTLMRQAKQVITL